RGHFCKSRKTIVGLDTNRVSPEGNSSLLPQNAAGKGSEGMDKKEAMTRPSIAPIPRDVERWFPTG
ncbi:MAG: hypothetical protein QXO76_05040, partial [Thermoproteota archaeon]